MFKKILAILTASMLLVTVGCGNKKEEPKEDTKVSQTDKAEDTKKNEEAVKEDSAEDSSEPVDVYAEKIMFTIEMQDGGVMKGELYPDLAPKTVENFVSLCENNFYDGLIFHRIIEGFMIQGGAYTKDMNSKNTKSIKGEFDSNGFENPLTHERGVISMARTDDPNSASSQFFIVHEDSSYLDGNYAAFGRITEGLDVLDEIAATKTTTYQNVMSDYPEEPPVIKTIKIDK